MIRLDRASMEVGASGCKQMGTHVDVHLCHYIRCIDALLSSTIA